ncbi:MAG: hypothetical protein GXC70_03415 [Sphingomonadaceae bacterium]|nr:hypothetical protein [Sphingomonadaceae bacterium]
MDQARHRLLEAALERAAGQLGDPTAPVMAAFYARFPEARASFEHHWPGKADRLEAEMVGNSLYFVMTWFERRSEVEITFGSSVPHHHHTLAVPVDWYDGLIEATVEVLAATCPQGAAAEAEMWQTLREGLTRAVRESL